MENNNKSYSPSSMPKEGSRSIGTSWGVKGDKIANSIGGTRSSYKIDHAYKSNNTNNIDNKMNGSFIHSYQPGRYAGLHEPGTYSRPVFGVNPDTYFSGNHKYFPTPFQPPSIDDNLTRSFMSSSDIKKGVKGYGKKGKINSSSTNDNVISSSINSSDNKKGVQGQGKESKTNYPSINDHVKGSAINGSGIKKGVQGHGWGNKTLYPIIDTPINIIPSSKLAEKLEKKEMEKKEKKK